MCNIYKIGTFITRFVYIKYKYIYFVTNPNYNFRLEDCM